MSLVYDDRDPAIEYSAGQWGEAGNAEAEFRGTTSYSDVAGATARVTFTGIVDNIMSYTIINVNFVQDEG